MEEKSHLQGFQFDLNNFKQHTLNIPTSYTHSNFQSEHFTPITTWDNNSTQRRDYDILLGESKPPIEFYGISNQRQEHIFENVKISYDIPSNAGQNTIDLEEVNSYGIPSNERQYTLDVEEVKPSYCINFNEDNENDKIVDENSNDVYVENEEKQEEIESKGMDDINQSEMDYMKLSLENTTSMYNSEDEVEYEYKKILESESEDEEPPTGIKNFMEGFVRPEIEDNVVGPFFVFPVLETIEKFSNSYDVLSVPKKKKKKNRFIYSVENYLNLSIDDPRLTKAGIKFDEIDIEKAEIVIIDDYIKDIFFRNKYEIQKKHKTVITNKGSYITVMGAKMNIIDTLNELHLCFKKNYTYCFYLDEGDRNIFVRFFRRELRQIAKNNNVKLTIESNIILRGPRPDVEMAVRMIEYLVSKILQKDFYVRIDDIIPGIVNKFDKEKDAIQFETKTYIQRVNNFTYIKNELHYKYQIYGLDRSSIKKAKESISNTFSNYKTKSVVKEFTFRPGIRDYIGANLNNIRMESKVFSLTWNQTNNEVNIQIAGNEYQIKTAEELMNDLFEEVDTFDFKHIIVPVKHITGLIGKGGITIKQLKNASGVIHFNIPKVINPTSKNIKAEAVGMPQTIINLEELIKKKILELEEEAIKAQELARKEKALRKALGGKLPPKPASTPTTLPKPASTPTTLPKPVPTSVRPRPVPVQSRPPTNSISARGRSFRGRGPSRPVR